MRSGDRRRRSAASQVSHAPSLGRRITPDRWDYSWRAGVVLYGARAGGRLGAQRVYHRTAVLREGGAHLSLNSAVVDLRAIPCDIWVRPRWCRRRPVDAHGAVPTAVTVAA